MGSDSPGLDGTVHMGAQDKIPAIVKCPNLIAMPDAACVGVRQRYLQQTSVLQRCNRWRVAEGRVQEIVGLAREQLQRKLLRRRRVPGFFGRLKGRDRIQTGDFELLAVKLRLAAWGREISFRKR